MCIVWDRAWPLCGHSKPTKMVLFCAEFRHKGECQRDDEVRQLIKKGKCPDCQAMETEC
jgi:hypothetical protein